jgi:hypothetical protein
MRNRARREAMALGPGQALAVDVVGDVEPDVRICVSMPPR